jgi:LppP/LprE lipoprotein
METAPDVLLLDWDLPGLCSTTINAIRAQLCVIAMSGRPEARAAALRHGVGAFICKGDAPDALLAALRTYAAASKSPRFVDGSTEVAVVHAEPDVGLVHIRDQVWHAGRRLERIGARWERYACKRNLNRMRAFDVQVKINLIAFALWLALLALPADAQDEGAWLDQPLAGWNQAGMSIPTPVNYAGNQLNPSCNQTFRWPETPEDQALVDAGWSLQAAYRGGWGLTVVDGASTYDGMCRPVGYNSFVFSNGVFAGTISPDPMDSRATGAGSVTSIQNGRVSARYLRYAPTDPLCCPSQPAVDVTFEIQSTPDGPVLVPVSTYVEGAT